MQMTNLAARLLLFILISGFMFLPARAENDDQTPKPKSDPSAKQPSNKPETKPEKSSQEQEQDIWNEVSFESEEDLQLTEKQVNQILEELKKKDPKKAEELIKLKTSDPEAFVTAIQEHIQSKKTDAPKDKQPPEKWREKLNQRHDKFLAWYKERYPDDHKELSELLNSDPDKFVQKVFDLMKIYEPIQRLEVHNPAMAEAMKKNLELQKRRDALLMQIRISSKEEQSKLVEELKAVVSERFDTIVQEKQLQFEWLRKRLDNLTKKLEERAAELDTLKKSKDQSVDDRLNELVERTEKVNWN